MKFIKLTRGSLKIMVNISRVDFIEPADSDAPSKGSILYFSGHGEDGMDLYDDNTHESWGIKVNESMNQISKLLMPNKEKSND